jgi:hypothetical protein
VLILLPPSEGKTAARRGAALDLDRLSLPGLNPVRQKVLDALVDLCAGDEGRARAVLGLGAGQADEVVRNACLRTAPVAAAQRLYSGVLYEALGLASLDARARRRAGSALLIFSALWGAVRIGDRIPAYRLSAGVNLPGLGPVTGYWRAELAPVLAPLAGTGLVLDLRSTGYAPMWRPSGVVAGRTATVRVLHEQRIGGVTRRGVVSHFNKATKGRLVRALLLAGAAPRTPGELATLLAELGYTVEASTVAGQPARLDVVVRDL